MILASTSVESRALSAPRGLWAAQDRPALPTSSHTPGKAPPFPQPPPISLSSGSRARCSLSAVWLRASSAPHDRDSAAREKLCRMLVQGPCTAMPSASSSSSILPSPVGTGWPWGSVGGWHLPCPPLRDPGCLLVKMWGSVSSTETRTLVEKAMPSPSAVPRLMVVTRQYQRLPLCASRTRAPYRLARAMPSTKPAVLRATSRTLLSSSSQRFCRGCLPQALFAQPRSLFSPMTGSMLGSLRLPVWFLQPMLPVERQLAAHNAAVPREHPPVTGTSTEPRSWRAWLARRHTGGRSHPTRVRASPARLSAPRDAGEGRADASFPTQP